MSELVRVSSRYVLCGEYYAPATEEVEYRGDRVEYRVRVATVLVVMVEAALLRRGRIAPGERVGVQFIEEAVHVLPAQLDPALDARAGESAPVPVGAR